VPRVRLVCGACSREACASAQGMVVVKGITLKDAGSAAVRDVLRTV
jgi:hypothetical protein